jgi:hypothetical protein
MGGILGSLGSVAGSLGPLGKVLGPVGTILSAVSTAQSLFGKDKQPRQEEVLPAQATPFSPSRPEEMNRPDSLSEFGTFTPEQQRSALATKGLNTGLGSDEESYYRNLVQRSLIGEGNQVQQDNPNFLLPVESQYFSRGGSDTSDIMKFLESISS